MHASTDPHNTSIVDLIARLVLIASCLIAQFGCDADTQVLGQDREPLDPGRATQRVFVSDGKVVQAWVADSPLAAAHQPKAFVLFFVGQADRADRYVADIADSWDRWPVEVWGMNYPGSGGSEGPAQIARVGAAATSLYDTVSRIAHNRPIFVQGVSLGTTVGLCVAARRPVDGIILTNPPPLRQLIVGEYSWWNFGLISNHIAGEIPADLDSLANASRCTAPAVILSAGSDQTVPPKYQRMVIEAYAGPKRIIEMPGLDHDDGLSTDAAAQLAAGKMWLWEMAKAHRTQAATSSAAR